MKNVSSKAATPIHTHNEQFPLAVSASGWRRTQSSLQQLIIRKGDLFKMSNSRVVTFSDPNYNYSIWYRS